MHHVLDSVFNFGEGDRLGPVKEHADDGVHAAEHLSQNFILVRKGETGRNVLSECVKALIGWKFPAEIKEKELTTMECRCCVVINMFTTCDSNPSSALWSSRFRSSSASLSSFFCWTLTTSSLALSSRAFSSASAETGAGDGEVFVSA